MKYKIFQLAKWEILRTFKQKMIEKKKVDIQHAKGLGKLLVVMQLQRAIRKLWLRFDRDRHVKKIMKKIIFKMTMYTIKAKRGVKRYGVNLEQRLERQTKHAITASSAVLIRHMLRERAKAQVKDFLNVRAGFVDFAQKIEIWYHKMLIIQRKLHLRYLEKEHKKWYGKVFKKEMLMTKIFLNTVVNMIHGARIYEAWEQKRDLEIL